MNRPRTRLLVDGGDPQETRKIKERLGFVDGQTTNPTLIANNPEIKKLLASGHKLSEREELDEYKKIVREISPLVGSAGVSIEVFSDRATKAEQMFAQGNEMFTWIPNAYIKYPCTTEGLRAAQMSVKQGIRVNLTLCFSQQQVAAVYSATKDTREPAYVSPFVGRLDDIGENGMDLIKNAKRMLEKGDGHLLILSASIRSVEHLLYAIQLDSDLATVPGKILTEWAGRGAPLPDANFNYAAKGKTIPYEELDLSQPWEKFNLQHELTTKGLDKFAADYKKTLAEASSAAGSDK
ncbi:MAG TPA: transaldolase family protein [Candidatus Acidoferrales bacterium]|nr:transaldolase family protein [Candidatus Acidoferrales bacterium]